MMFDVYGLSSSYDMKLSMVYSIFVILQEDNWYYLFTWKNSGNSGTITRISRKE